MGIVQTINVYIHVIAGGSLLLLGLIPMFSQKGGSRHKAAGRLYIKLFLIVLATAVIGVIFFRSPPALMAVTFSASYNFISGVRALKIQAQGPQLIDNIMSVFAIGAGTMMLVVMSENGTASWSPVMGYSVIGMTAMIALYDLSRNFWVTAWTRKAWPIDHGLKIVGSYFAAASAASGNLLRDYQPWSQVSPAIIGTGLSLVLVYVYLKQPNRSLS